MKKPEIISMLNKKSRNISEVLVKMELSLSEFRKNPKTKSLEPFLDVYYDVTKSVLEKRFKKNFYENPKKLEELDIEFSNLYFSPLKKYLEKNKKLSPWKEYFKYCEKGHIPFVKMLVGINAHINGDLAEALSKSNYKERKDFLKINKILEKLIPEVMKHLAFEDRDLFGAAGVFLPNLVNKEFKKIIVRWREDAWENSKKLRKNPEKIIKIHEQTENVSKEIVKIFAEAVHLKETPYTFLKRLERLRLNFT